MSEKLNPTANQEDKRIYDVEKAHVMAKASDRNETNKIAFKKIAKAHILNPEAKESPLRAKMVIDSEHSSNNPANRLVEDVVEGGYAYAFTAEQATEEARREKEEADKRAAKAAEQYDKLMELYK